MQYSYTTSCSILRTVNNETTRLRNQFINVAVKNRAASVASSTVLNECIAWASRVRGLLGQGISYADDEEINFSRVNSIVSDDPDNTVNITFICKRINGTKPEFLQFTLEDASSIVSTFLTQYTTTLDGITGVTNSIDNYIIANAIIDM